MNHARLFRRFGMALIGVLLIGLTPAATLAAGTATATAVLSSSPGIPPTSTYGDTVTFTATVTAEDSTTPTGDVQFLDGVTLLDTKTLDIAGEATLTLTNLAAGDHPSITAHFLGDGTYAESISSALDQIVTKAHLTVTADPASRAYGVAEPTFTATISGFTNSETLGTSGVAGSASCTTDALLASHPGPYTITCTQGTLAATNYDFTTFNTGVETITKAHLTVTADPASRAYGVAEPTFTATISGFTNSETLGTSGVAGSASCTTDALLASHPGPYTITCTQGTLAATNYDFTTFVTGVETIGKATPVITWADPAPITYGTALSATQLDATSGGVAGTFVYTPVSGTVLSAGAGQTLSVVFHPTDLTDYVDGISKSVTIDVTKAHLTVTADPASRAYGVAEPTFTATISGFTNSETLGTSGVAGSASCTTDALLASHPGPYTITCTQGTLAATNYDFTTFVTGVETIGKATPVITWADPAPITYGTALSATQLDATSGGVAGTFVYTPVSGTVLSAGAGQTLSVVFHPTDLTDYVDGISKSVTIDVTKAHLTVTADPASRAYGVAEPTFTATISGFTNSETLGTSGVAGSASCTTDALLASHPGPYTITCTQGTLAATNYDFTTFNTGVETITKAHLTVTADPASRAYGVAEPTFTATISGFTNSETLGTSGVAGSASCTTDALLASHPGPYTITCTQGTLAATNYDFTTFVTGVETIGKATPVITWADPAPITYGTALSATQLDATSGGVAGTFVYTPVSGTVLSAGAGQTLSVVFHPTDLTDYVDGISKSVTITITKAVLSVNAVAASRVYGGSDPSFTATYSGFVSGDNAGNSGITGTASCTRTAGNTVAGSPYTITCTPGTLLAPNYSFTTGTTAAFTITKAVLSVNAVAASRVYGGSDPSFTATYSGFVSGDNAGNSGITGTASCTRTAGNTVAGSPYTITCTPGTLLAPNYSFTTGTTAAFTITKAVLSVNAVAASRVYGGSDPSFTATYSGFVSGDNAGNSGITGTASCTRTAGNTVAGSPYTITCTPGTLLAPNYSFTTGTTAAFTITKAHLTVTANPASRAYGVAEPPFTATLSGFTHGETLGTSGVTGSANCTTNAIIASAPGPYTITCTQGTLAATNYDFTTFVTGTETITKATPVITWADPAPITYGTALSATQLNATSGGVAGTFVYTPASGTVLSVGTGQTLSVVFHPTDLTDYVDGISKSVTIDVVAGGAASFGVSAPVTVTVGVPFSVTVTAKDSGGNTAISYRGTVHFTSTDGSAVVPGDYTFLAGDNGVRTFTNLFTLNTVGAGTQTLTARDVGTSSITGTSAGIAFNPVSCTYKPLTPARLLDTRDGTGGLSGPFRSHVARTFQVTGHGGVPSNATAVTGNLTVTQQSSLGFLFIGPVAANNPTSSNLNFPLNDDRANAVTVALGAGGTLSITYAAPTLGPTAQVIFDVTGYFVPDMSGATYFALTPTRILDSRDGTGGLSGPFSSHVARTFQVTGHGGVPANATAVTGNLTVTGQTSLGFLFIGPIGANNPTSSNLNFPMNDDRANAVTVALSGTGKLSITYAAPILLRTAHVIFDVTGYFVPDTSGAVYVPLTPTRILDSRDGTGGLSGAFSSHVARTFQVTGHGGVPSNATAVTGNLTVTGQTSLGFLFIGPIAMNNPTSSTLNFPMNDDRANAVAVALGADGKLSITYAAPSLGPTANVIFDVAGYFVR